ncbi:DUF2490 domain-containing protein [Methylobacter tundripaludum]|uniref:DUF2490 domain-containing protein n=1 Tax=Methylobacter tundripaludum TaxID=173365 RepID=UPI0029622131|nr:DUF2490 domain-containing protein [Methylobacter tundripaludum]
MITGITGIKAFYEVQWVTRSVIRLYTWDTHAKRRQALCLTARCVARIPLCLANQHWNSYLQDHDRKQCNNVRVRPRQMIRFMHPLEFEPRLSLIIWDEFFIRVNSTPAGVQFGFDQNRAFAGLGWTFNKNFRVESGYLNQYLDDATHTNNIMHHLIMGALFINF